MLELYLNTTTRTFYDADGDPFRDNNPQGAFQSRETIKIYLCTETPEAGEEAADPQSWTRDTYFGTIEGISAKLTCDNDYIHKLKGTLTGELPSGSVSSITATISGATLGKIPEFGTVRLYSPNGNYESVAYSERSLSGETVTFTVSGTITNSYSTGAIVDCDQSPYCEAYVDAEQSDIANGELVFDLAYDSVRLREEMQYTDTEKLQVKGLELLFYKTNSDATQEKIKRFLCETFIITGTLGSIGYESEPPEPVINMIESAVLTAVNKNKPEIDSESGNWFVGETDTNVHATMNLSIGTVSSGDSSSATITGDYPNKTLNLVLEKGDKAPELKIQYSVDGQNSWHEEYASGDAYLRTSTNNGVNWSSAVRFLGNPGTDGKSSYTYVAYASDSEGTGFSLTPSDSLKYRAEIHTQTPIETPDSDDFSEAVWVKYIGTAGTSAGFGTPTAQVQTLEAGSNATASVTASGENTAKIFAFNFGIPKGGNGKSAYELWKEEPGNSDKTLDDFFNAYRGADGTGLNVRGAYDSASTYQKTETATDAVQYNGSLWGYINDTAGSGNAPPETSATTSNDYWTLLVAKGDPGENGVTPTIDPDTKHWMIGEEDTGVLAEAKVEGGTATFSSVSENIATLATSSVPVGVRTNKGNYYPVEKGSVVVNISGGTVQLDVSPYLAYDNSSSFSGTWRVYFAAGEKGDQGNNALSFQIGTVTTLSPGSDATVTATVSNDGLVTLNFGIPEGKEFTYEDFTSAQLNALKGKDGTNTVVVCLCEQSPESLFDGMIWVKGGTSTAQYYTAVGGVTVLTEMPSDVTSQNNGTIVIMEAE